SQDREAISQANEEYQKLYEPFHKIMKDSSEKLDKVLTAEQKAKFQDYQATSMINSMTGGVKLTADQMKQLKAAYKDSTSGAEGAASLQETLSNVLSPEQKTGIRKNSLVMSAKAQFSTAKLTEEQMKQVDAICAEAAK